MRSFMFFTFHIKSSKSSVCFTFIAHLNQCSMATWSGSWALGFSSNRIGTPLPGPGQTLPEPAPRSKGDQRAAV